MSNIIIDLLSPHEFAKIGDVVVNVVSQCPRGKFIHHLVEIFNIPLIVAVDD